MRRVSVSALNLLACGLMICGGAQFARTQTRDVRLISARAGGINFVAGSVTVKRADGDATPLTTNDDLRSGDVVATGGDGRVEVLLNPGSYLRLAENSEFELIDNSLDNLRLKLKRGAAVAEVISFDDKLPVVSLETPQTKIIVVKSGIYHVKVLAPGTTEVAVYKGGARVGNGALLVKSGNKAISNGGDAPVLAKLSKQETDALDVWSRTRAEFLAKANARITRNPTLISALTNWHRFNNLGSGLWGFDSLTGGWAFVPLYRPYLTCPYGFNYNNRLVVTPPNNAACPGCTVERFPVRRGDGGNSASVGDNGSKVGGTDRWASTQSPAQSPAQSQPAPATRFERQVEAEPASRSVSRESMTMKPPL